MHHKAGYTLFETVVVLAILSLALTLVTPMIFKGISGTRLKATARQITAALRFARNIAITKRATMLFSVDLDGEKIGLQLIARDRPKIPSPSPEGGDEPQAAAPAEGRSFNDQQVFASSKDLEIKPPIELIRFYDLEGYYVDSGSAGIVFFPKGNCSGGVIEIGKPDGQHLLISVDPVTANVDVTEAQQ